MFTWLSNIPFILLALVILGVVVMIHEFGHYLVGRLTGIGVIEFAVGMGPKLFGWKRKGIQYSLRLIPLGGYCRFVGEDEDADDPAAMNNQPVWKRFLTVFAGPFMNFLLAFLVGAALLMAGQFYSSQAWPELYAVVEGSPAEDAGLMPGDVVTEAGGKTISFDMAGVETMRGVISAAQPEQGCSLTVSRGGETLSFTLFPQYDETEKRNMIGISFRTEYAMMRYGFFEAFPQSAKLIGETTVATVDFLKDLVGGLIRGKGVDTNAVSGPVGIVSTITEDVKAGFGTAVSAGLWYIVYWLFVISLNLGIMNLLPLPALDGGRLVFLIVEGIRRKPVKREREGLVHFIGFVALIGLILLITWKDVMNLF